jgi:hypothetical protein
MVSKKWAISFIFKKKSIIAVCQICYQLNPV